MQISSRFNKRILKKILVSLAISLFMLAGSLSLKAYASLEDTVLVAYKVDECAYLPFDANPYDLVYRMIVFQNGYTYSESRSLASTWYKELFLVNTWQYIRAYKTH